MVRSALGCLSSPRCRVYKPITSLQARAGRPWLVFGGAVFSPSPQQVGELRRGVARTKSTAQGVSLICNSPSNPLAPQPTEYTQEPYSPIETYPRCQQTDVLLCRRGRFAVLCGTESARGGGLISRRKANRLSSTVSTRSQTHKPRPATRRAGEGTDRPGLERLVQAGAREYIRPSTLRCMSCCSRPSPNTTIGLRFPLLHSLLLFSFPHFRVLKACEGRPLASLIHRQILLEPSYHSRFHIVRPEHRTHIQVIRRTQGRRSDTETWNLRRHFAHTLRFYVAAICATQHQRRTQNFPKSDTSY